MPLLVTTAVLVVVGVGEHGIAPLLDDGVVNDGGYEHLGGRGLATAATRTHRKVEGGDLAAVLVAERDMDGRAVIADLHVTRCEGVALYLVELGGDGLVLHGIGALLVKRLVHLHGRDGDVDVARSVGCLALTIDGNLLDRASTAEVLPRCGGLP